MTPRAQGRESVPVLCALDDTHLLEPEEAPRAGQACPPAPAHPARGWRKGAPAGLALLVINRALSGHRDNHREGVVCPNGSLALFTPRRGSAAVQLCPTRGCTAERVVKRPTPKPGREMGKLIQPAGAEGVEECGPSVRRGRLSLGGELGGVRVLWPGASRRAQSHRARTSTRPRPQASPRRGAALQFSVASPGCEYRGVREGGKAGAASVRLGWGRTVGRRLRTGAAALTTPDGWCEAAPSATWAREGRVRARRRRGVNARRRRTVSRLRGAAAARARVRIVGRAGGDSEWATWRRGGGSRRERATLTMRRRGGRRWEDGRRVTEAGTFHARTAVSYSRALHMRM